MLDASLATDSVEAADTATISSRFDDLLDRHGFDHDDVGLFAGQLAIAAVDGMDVDLDTRMLIGPALVTMFLTGFELALRAKERQA